MIKWLQALGGIFSIGTEALKGYQERKKAKLEGDIEIHKAQVQAKIDRLKTGQQADISWENLSIEKSGWKDEFFTIVLSIPVILCFIPGMDVYVYNGFVALEKTPEWFRWAFGIAVGSSFGYRKIADFMSLRKGD